MKTYIKTACILTTVGMVLTGCQTQQVASTAPTTQISCSIPKIDVITDKVNQQTQSKGGLDITVVPALYTTVRTTKTTIQHVEPTFSERILMEGDPKTLVFVEETQTPQLKALPSRLEFTVKIHNQLNRVFHGQGAVVQFNVDGKLIPFNNTDYKEFSGGIVPPLNDADLAIKGPPLNMLKDKGTISIFLYDVVTATDAAGNTTEKQNYTWDFTYTMQPVTETGTIQVKRGTININQYERIMMQQAQQPQGQAQENSMQ